jgi:hypothetical protein
MSLRPCSSSYPDNRRIVRVRKQPKEISSNTKTARKPFGDQPTKELEIPVMYDSYNHHMGDVDTADQLAGHNSGFRRLRRRAIQAIDYFLLRTVLVNCYLIALYSETDGERLINFRSQDNFCIQLVESLLDLGTHSKITSAKVPRKRGFSHMNAEAFEVPVHRHEHVKIPTKKDCAACKGVRFSDNPPKRVALAEIARNRHRSSTRRTSWYGCKQCNVAICRKSDCWDVYHENS